jgi:hypothetical protein
LLRIEEELGENAVYAGENFRKWFILNKYYKIDYYLVFYFKFYHVKFTFLLMITILMNKLIHGNKNKYFISLKWLGKYDDRIW